MPWRFQGCRTLGRCGRRRQRSRCWWNQRCRGWGRVWIWFVLGLSIWTLRCWSERRIRGRCRGRSIRNDNAFEKSSLSRSCQSCSTWLWWRGITRGRARRRCRRSKRGCKAGSAGVIFILILIIPCFVGVAADSRALLFNRQRSVHLRGWGIFHVGWLKTLGYLFNFFAPYSFEPMIGHDPVMQEGEQERRGGRQVAIWNAGTAIQRVGYWASNMFMEKKKRTRNRHSGKQPNNNIQPHDHEFRLSRLARPWKREK